MNGQLKKDNQNELREFLLEGIYKSIADLKDSGKQEAGRFSYLLELAEFAGNPKNEITISLVRESSNNFSLVDGIFLSEEANNILSVLYNSKIDFHVRSAVSHELRTGEPAPSHIQRISELQDAYNRVRELIMLSSACNMKMKINAVVHIELIP